MFIRLMKCRAENRVCEGCKDTEVCQFGMEEIRDYCEAQRCPKWDDPEDCGGCMAAINYLMGVFDEIAREPKPTLQ